MIKNIGTKKIYFTKYDGIFERIVYKDTETGTYWCSFYGEKVEVRQIDKSDRPVSGWVTVNIDR